MTAQSCYKDTKWVVSLNGDSLHFCCLVAGKKTNKVVILVISCHHVIPWLIHIGCIMLNWNSLEFVDNYKPTISFQLCSLHDIECLVITCLYLVLATSFCHRDKKKCVFSTMEMGIVLAHVQKKLAVWMNVLLYLVFIWRLPKTRHPQMSIETHGFEDPRFWEPPIKHTKILWHKWKHQPMLQDTIRGTSTLLSLQKAKTRILCPLGLLISHL